MFKKIAYTMPFFKRKNRGKNTYRVYSVQKDGTHRMHAKATTLKKADKQLRLLRSLEW
jgi:hypothetical protein